MLDLGEKTGEPLSGKPVFLYEEVFGTKKKAKEKVTKKKTLYLFRFDKITEYLGVFSVESPLEFQEKLSEDKVIRYF